MKPRAARGGMSVLGMVALALALLVVGLTISVPATTRSDLTAGLLRRAGDDRDWRVGLVRQGRLSGWGSTLVGPPRLTKIARQEARSPESGELDLGPYEGRAIVVRGYDQGGWLYSAQVVGDLGPLLGGLARLWARAR